MRKYNSKEFRGLYRSGLLLILCLISFYPSNARCDEYAQQEGFGDEATLFQEIPSVYGASKYEQKITEAPSSVTIITSSEIQKYGYRTLAEILRSVRGFYVTYDRNYSYVGVRGFDRPGDFNTRILLLVDGHRTNDNIFDQAFIGTDFIVDIDLIDRIEIIRGPGSSLYGNNAFFAVINVITKRGRDFQGAEVSGEAGSFQSYTGRLSYGTKLSNGIEALFSGSLFDSQGHRSLFFKEFDQPQFNNGVAEHADGDRSGSLFGKVSYSDFTLNMAYISRDKTIPTAPYGTLFNDDRTKTTDTRGYFDLKYQHSFENQWDINARLYYDFYKFNGDYVFDNAEPGDPPAPYLNKDEARGQWWGTEIKASRKWLEHRLTIGTEYQGNLKQDQKNFDEIAPFASIDVPNNSWNWAFYAQDEYSLLNNLILNVGARYDYYNTFGGNISPRVAFIYNPVEKTTFKLLYGEAFRAPNVYEQLYQDTSGGSLPNLSLQPEKIRTYELVYDQYLGDHLLMTATGFYYKINNLITLQDVTASGADYIQYQNLDTDKAKGFEIEFDGNLAGGLEGKISYTFQKTEGPDGTVLSNSPKHLAKLNVIAPVVKDKFFASMELQYMSNRKTVVLGDDTGAVFLANVTIFCQKLVKGLNASAGVFNIFDKKYGDPGSLEHLQDTIEQDGRTFRAKLTYAF